MMTTQPKANARTIFTMVRGHHVLASALGPQSVVLDVGANHGDFAGEMQARYGCSCFMVEANPHLCMELERTRSERLLHAAVCARSGTLALNIARNDEGSSILTLPITSPYDCVLAETTDVPAKTLAEVCDHFGLSDIDLLKMDIEGAEVETLKNCPAAILKRIKQITVEFHCAEVFGFGGRDAAESVIHRLRALGFTAYVFDPELTDVLFVNHTALGTHIWQRALMRLRISRPRWLGAIWRHLPGSIRQAVRMTLGATKE